MVSFRKDIGLTFDDVLIVPKFSDIASRDLIDLSQEFIGEHISLPIVSANMDYVTELDMAMAMWEQGGFYVYHRFMPDERLLDFIDAMNLSVPEVPISISIGTRDINIEFNKVVSIINSFSWPSERDDFKNKVIVTVDVAHGAHQKVVDMVKRLKAYGVRVIAGNVATREGFLRLASAGADAVKAGIGPGAACTTREVTGVGVPQLTVIMECDRARRESYPNVKLIADGGIKSSGDIVKALAAGADVVMLGSLLAGTTECPGEVRVGPDNRRWRPYRGQSIFGVNGDKFVPEGVNGWVEEKGPVADVLRKLAGGIRSGLSYVGAMNLSELKELTEFIKVSPGTHLESATRIPLSVD